MAYWTGRPRRDILRLALGSLFGEVKKPMAAEAVDMYLLTVYRLAARGSRCAPLGLPSALASPNLR
jgi:hypothetical protein